MGNLQSVRFGLGVDVVFLEEEREEREGKQRAGKNRGGQ
jgi:hypothetical protein